MLEIFELRLPAKVQSLTAGRRGGALGVLFMGLTFVVSAFTCTAPILGSIITLAAGANGSAEALIRPVLGMTAFSLALALPFFVLALFPPLLSKLPRSGAWMSTVKGAFGFLELAASLKFLSNADLAWRWTILPREVFLNLSAITLLAGGLWLLGKIDDRSLDAGRQADGRAGQSGRDCSLPGPFMRCTASSGPWTR